MYIAGSDDLIIDLASEPALYCVEPKPPSDDPWGDLGDAPDRTNNWGRPMSTYGGAVAASFPTVHRTADRQPSGPKHLSGSSAVLGACVSLEKEADIGPDDDFVTNIDPYLALDDHDGCDDAVQTPISLPHCQLTAFDFDVTIVDGDPQPRYLSAWMDFNRDGDWDDTLTCIDPGSGQPVSLPERIAHNFEFTEPIGGHTITVPDFRSYDPSPGGNIWARLTLTRYEITSEDGRGLLFPFSYSAGETEDYYLGYVGGSEYAP